MDITENVHYGEWKLLTPDTVDTGPSIEGAHRAWGMPELSGAKS